MFRINNTFVGILHTLPLFLGLAAMGVSAYIRVHGDCQNVLKYPLLFSGLFVSVVSALGLVGALCRVNAALYLYLIATFFVILAFASFTLVALVVVTKGNAPHHASRVGFTVRDFSPWLRHYVSDDHNWDDTKRCFAQARICHGLAVDAHNVSLVFKHSTTTQFGCCKPPEQCRFKLNGTLWEAPKAGAAAEESDCRSWSNREEKMCFDCDSCKGGVLAGVRKQWRDMSIVNACVVLLLTIIYVFACYAIRNNRLEYSKYTAQRNMKMRILNSNHR
ncbi:Tetraspanin/Peripherin [Vigna unguiculata]|uniref:Tetraspanin/Peripherin n=2 Tax=Vigna unguiculata TaxID=3917 RepID=A0A4D6NM24_VIGUN|nr:Tetraspanin/Peripherin [Vigna unguiculata]